jgi:DNA-binding transcriptional ArsR family regulator
MRQLEAALKAAGDPTRTRILKMLEANELCVCQIQAVLRLAPSTVSKHLALLKASGLVADRKDGRWVHYSLASEDHNPYAQAVLRLIRGALKRDPKILDDSRRLKAILKVPVADLCSARPHA